MIGSAVTRLLLERGAEVRAHAGPPGTATTDIPEDVPISYCDIADVDAVRALVREAEAVVHLAGPASAAASFVSPTEYARTHVVGTAAVLEACRAAGVRRLVHVSSAEVYGQPTTNPVGEGAPTLPRSPYGAAKLGGEALVNAFCPATGITAIVLRPFSVYGPRSPDTSLVGRLLRAALDDDIIRLSSLRPVRDYVHVDDVSAAVGAALVGAEAESPTAGVRYYNVASGVGTAVVELAALVLAAAGRSADIEETPVADRPYGTDISELIGDVSRAAAGLGWSAEVPLAEGIAGALETFRRRR